MVHFPDPSAREEPIDSYDNVELLYKKGVKILRINKRAIGWETDKPKYEIIKEFFKGNVLNIGLGLGTSVDTILECTEVNKVVVHEIEPGICKLYKMLHSNKKVEIINTDAFNYSLVDKYDCILYEIIPNSQELFDKSIIYLKNLKNHLKTNGIILIEHNEYSLELAVKVKDIYQTGIRSMGTGLGKRKIWIILNKKEE